MREIYKYLLIMVVPGIMFFPSNTVQAQFGKKQKEGGENLEKEVQKATYYFTEGVKYFILEDMEKAKMLFQKSLKFDKNNAAAHYKIAQIYKQNGDLSQALHHAQQAVSIDNNNIYYYQLTAKILTKQSNFDQAANMYEEMLKIIPAGQKHLTQQYLFDLASLYLYQNKYDKAIDIYNRVENNFGLQKKTTYQKQKIYLETNKLDKAIAEGEKLINAYPGHGDIVIHQAEILISNGQPKKAIPYLEKLIAQNSESQEARFMLGKIFFDDKQFKKAEKNLIKAYESQNLDAKSKIQFIANNLNQLPNKNLADLLVQLGENLVEAHPQNGEAYVINGDLNSTLGNKKKAKDFYLKSTKFDASNFNVWRSIISIESELNQTDSVLKHTQEALEYFPNQGALYYYNGSAHLQKKNYEEAIDKLERGRRMASNNNKQLLSIFNGMLGDAYHGIEKYEASNEAYDKALEYNPNNKHVLNNYSYYLSIREENLDYALKLSKKLINLNPDEPTYLDTHAWVLYQKGDYKKARKYLEDALAKGTKSGTIVEHYGDVLFKLGETDKAVKQWKKAKGMDDTSDLLEKKIADGKLYE